MKTAAGLLISFVFLYAVSASATQQHTTRASLTPVADRQAAPSFRLASAWRKVVQLSDFRGKPVVVNLWATACGGCRAEIPAFVQLDRNYKSQGLVVIGVSMDILYEDLKNASEAWARIAPFVKANLMAYQVVLDDGTVERAFNVTALPATYLVDRSGRMAAAYLGVVDAPDLEDNVKTLLNERR